MNELNLVNDKDVAELLSFSPSWVRQQRFLREHQRPHTFAVAPIYIGNSPRYLIKDIYAWIEDLPRPKNEVEA